jgi:hypothetical protein
VLRKAATSVFNFSELIIFKMFQQRYNIVIK